MSKSLPQASERIDSGFTATSARYSLTQYEAMGLVMPGDTLFHELMERLGTEKK